MCGRRGRGALGCRALFARIPGGVLRPGLTNDAAADTAWVIASPDTHDQLVHHAGYDYDQLEDWVRDTLSAALLPGALPAATPGH